MGTHLGPCARSNNDCEVVPFPQVTHDFLLAPPEMAERKTAQAKERWRRYQM